MDEVIEIFGKRLKVVKDKDGSADYCGKCAIKHICYSVTSGGVTCKDAKGEVNRHFEEVDEEVDDDIITDVKFEND